MVGVALYAGVAAAETGMKATELRTGRKLLPPDRRACGRAEERMRSLLHPESIPNSAGGALPNWWGWFGSLL